MYDCFLFPHHESLLCPMTMQSFIRWCCTSCIFQNRKFKSDSFLFFMHLVLPTVELMIQSHLGSWKSINVWLESQSSLSFCLVESRFQKKGADPPFHAVRFSKSRPSLLWPPSVFMLSSSWMISDSASLLAPFLSLFYLFTLRLVTPSSLSLSCSIIEKIPFNSLFRMYSVHGLWEPLSPCGSFFFCYLFWRLIRFTWAVLPHLIAWG